MSDDVIVAQARTYSANLSIYKFVHGCKACMAVLLPNSKFIVSKWMHPFCSFRTGINSSSLVLSIYFYAQV